MQFFLWNEQNPLAQLTFDYNSTGLSSSCIDDGGSLYLNNPSKILS